MFYLDVLSSSEEIEIGIQSIQTFNKPFVVGIHFKKNGLLPSGEKIKDVINKIKSYNPLAITGSCVAYEDVIEAKNSFIESGLPFGFKINAFKEIPKGWKPDSSNPNLALGKNEDLTAFKFKEISKEFIDMGAKLIGGCCEITVTYIQNSRFKMIILTILFLITACIYSSVGFGGGSTYLALLLLWGVPFTIFPVIALCCNIIVVLGNCINYTRAGNLNLRMIAPYLIGSVPLAYVGGSLAIEKDIFEILLFIVLSIAGLLLLVKFKSYDDDKKYREIPFVISLLIGGTLGFISGVVGIGGGIFLSPILFLIRAAKPKDIITTASIFILINSIAGVFGQLTKNETLNYVLEYWPLLIAVLVGGQIGNFINIKQ